jgi:pyruvate formate lyase activating enzyme
MTVDRERCTLCGTCVRECHAEAISIDGDRVVHDEYKCKGCGRCASLCPQTAVNAEIENIDEALEELMGRIEGMIDIS